MRVLGTDVSETLMVGDNYATDIMAGINAGMDTPLRSHRRNEKRTYDRRYGKTDSCH